MMNGIPGGVLNLTAQEVAARLQAGGVTLVDVREAAEYAAEHIPGAVLQPLSAFDPAALPAGALIFQCGSGKRSASAVAACQAAGLPHAAHLAGGIAAWKAAGLKVTTG